MPAFFALISALSFGASDYVGGKLSRVQDATLVTATSQFFAFFVYILLACIIPGRFSWVALFFGFLSGISSAIGLNFFYAALARGVVGVVAPVTALLTASIPAFWSIFIKGERVTPLFLAGSLVAAGAIAFLAIPNRGSRNLEEEYEQIEENIAHMSSRAWLLTLAGGIVLSFSLIALSHTSTSSGCWPLVGVGIAAVIFSVFFAYIKTGKVFLPREHQSSVLFMVVCMALAYAAQLYAARSGALAVASVIGALYPIPTIILARVFDNEKMSANQTIGACCALISIALIALS